MKETITLIAAASAVVLGGVAVGLELNNRKKIKNLEEEIDCLRSSMTAETVYDDFCETTADDLDVKIPDEETTENVETIVPDKETIKNAEEVAKDIASAKNDDELNKRLKEANKKLGIEDPLGGMSLEEAVKSGHKIHFQ